MKPHNVMSGEKGAVLIGTLLVLVAVTAIGLTLSRVSGFELDMSVNEKCKEVARYNSESCSIATARLVRLVLDAADRGALGIPERDGLARGVSYPGQGETDAHAVFARKLLRFDSDAICEDSFINLPGPNDVNRTGADIRALESGPMGGMASLVHVGGYDYGAGMGSAGGGGVTLWYQIACRGQGCNRSADHVAYSRYRKTIGINGGM